MKTGLSKGRKGRHAPRVAEGKAAMRGSQPFRRWSALALSMAATVAVLALIAGFVSTVSLQSAAAREEIRARLSVLAGHTVSIDGAGEFSLLPIARLSLSGVRIGDPGAPDERSLTIASVVADFDLWQALLGRARIEHIVLVRPEAQSAAVFLDPSLDDPSGAKPKPPVVATADRYRALTGALGSFLSRFGEVRTVDIRDGVFRMGQGSGVDISSVNLTIEWPSPGRAASLSGAYVWNGEPTDIDVRVADPVSFLAGGPSALDFSMAAPPLTAGFSGSATMGEASDISGQLTLATPSLARAVRWLGNARASVPDIGALSIATDLAAKGPDFNFRNAKVGVGGFSGQGAMEMRLGSSSGRPAINGTLAFGRFDLSSVVQAVAPIPETLLGLQRRIAVDFIDDLDLDLRISAQYAVVGTMPVSDLAATVKFDSGIASVDVGDASLLGGRGQARLTIDSRSATPIAKATASLAGTDTASLLSALGFGAIGVSGTSDVSAAASGPIQTWADFLKRNAASFDVVSRNGTITGFDPLPFLSEGSRQLSLGRRQVLRPYDSLKTKIATAGPLVQITAFDLDTPSGALHAGGALSVLSGKVDIAGSVEPANRQLSASDAAFISTKPIAFKLSGDWPDPVVVTEPFAKPM